MRAVRPSQCGDIASLMQTFRRALDHAVARFPDVCNVVFSDAFYLGARRMPGRLAIRRRESHLQYQVG